MPHLEYLAFQTIQDLMISFAILAISSIDCSLSSAHTFYEAKVKRKVVDCRRKSDRSDMNSKGKARLSDDPSATTDSTSSSPSHFPFALPGFKLLNCQTHAQANETRCSSIPGDVFCHAAY